MNDICVYQCHDIFNVKWKFLFRSFFFAFYSLQFFFLLCFSSCSLKVRAPNWEFRMGKGWKICIFHLSYHKRFSRFNIFFFFFCWKKLDEDVSCELIYFSFRMNWGFLQGFQWILIALQRIFAFKWDSWPLKRWLTWKHEEVLR